MVDLYADMYSSSREIFSKSDVNCKTDPSVEDSALSLYLDRQRVGSGTMHNIIDFKMVRG